MSDPRGRGAGDPGPIVAPRSKSAAGASHPEIELEESRYNHYEANPVPWWISLVWASFFLFGVLYLVINLVDG